MIYIIGAIRNAPKDTATTNPIKRAKNAGTLFFTNASKTIDITYPTDANQNEPINTIRTPATDNITANKIGAFPS